MEELLIGRQPIFNRKQAVEAYELLYRSNKQTNSANIIDGDLATIQVVLDSISQIGLDSLVGNDKKAYINATRNFILKLKETPGLLPVGRVVVEVLEDIPIDTQLIDALRVLRHERYSLALDDVVDVQKITRILGFANIIKIDLMGFQRQGQTETEKLLSLETQLRNVLVPLNNHPVYLLAEKVETQAEYALCHRLGFDLFQGYYLCKPSIVKGRKLEVSRMVILRSISTMQDPNCTPRQLESIISQDVGMVNRLLRLINSSFYSLPTTIKSVSQAIAMIGTKQLQAWMTLMLMSKIDKPPELTNIALQRAKLCENFARAKGLPNPDTYFLVGLLSVLDALMDMPMEELLNNMPVSKEVRAALLNYQGEYGQVLRIVLGYEQGDWGLVSKLGLATGKIGKIYLDTLLSVSNSVREMSQAASI